MVGARWWRLSVGPFALQDRFQTSEMEQDEQALRDYGGSISILRGHTHTTRLNVLSLEVQAPCFKQTLFLTVATHSSRSCKLPVERSQLTLRRTPATTPCSRNQTELGITHVELFWGLVPLSYSRSIL